MKRILPRFSRCFLIAVLAAAVVGPLAPTGTAAGESSEHPTLTVSPSSAVPGQPVTVSGAGFGSIPNVNLTLTGGGLDNRANGIRVNTDGTFRYTGRVPFTEETVKAGSKTWTASGTGRAASSSGFTIQRRQVFLSPSVARPGATAAVFGSGWGVKTRGGVSSQVTVTMRDSEGNTIPNAIFGPFAVGQSGEFIGSIIVPADIDMPRLMVTATDNNGPAVNGGTDGFSANQTAEAALRVSTANLTVTPNVAVTGSVITVSGKGFPASTTLASLDFGGADLLPSPVPMTDESGSFTATLAVPHLCTSGSSCPGAVVVTVRVENVTGHASFIWAWPTITLSTDTVRPRDTITITGSGFSASANVDTINIGQYPVLPIPNPRTDGLGGFTATVEVPALNPGQYTMTVRTGARFTATHPVRIGGLLIGPVVPPEALLRSLTSRGLLTLAAAAGPGGEEFGAYVPGLPGDTLFHIPPNGVLVLTLAEDARISVGGQPPVDVAADTPTFFALGVYVSVTVVEHDQ